MKSYFAFSFVAHGFLLAALVTAGTLLSKPRMSYYGIDLMSVPAGGPVAGPSASPVQVPAPAAPKVSVPKVAPPAARQAPAELPDQDTLRLLAKLKKKRLALQKSAQSETPAEPASNSDDGAPVPASGGRVGMGGTGSASGIVADAGGLHFPYPWYLKAIADRLDQKWKPEQFSPGTTCVVSFVISRSGQISDSKLSKVSGDALFDQLALRAVLYSNPLPPLPNGYPEETLNVHMTFVGRR
ncbi:MAG TPA: energy transducer TonB [Elusimicrobiota bacterium]|nr:energy transducer TonB [Elusimicrobiota bacterium]